MPPNDREGPMTESPLCTGHPLAKALTGLEPLPSLMNRDQLMFAAGSAGRDRSVAFWKRAFAAQTAAIGLLIGIGVANYAPTVVNPTPEMVEKAPEKPVPPKPQTEVAPAPRTVPQPVPESPIEYPSVTLVAATKAELQERARWLELRANIFEIGLNVLPTMHQTTPTLDRVALEQSLQLPPGILAAPVRPVVPKPPLDPEQE